MVLRIRISVPARAVLSLLVIATATQPASVLAAWTRTDDTTGLGSSSSSSSSQNQDDASASIPFNAEQADVADSLFVSFDKVPCHENGVIHAWCSSSISSPDLECAIHPSTNTYACRCELDPSLCPEECINAADSTQPPLWTTPHSIMCRGIPQDEPNFILVQPKEVTESLPLHHCENNALVANWCNEAQLGKSTGGRATLDCLLLPAMDEYTCSCTGNHKACPTECVNGLEPDRVTKYAIRCQGIPQDTPNYIVLETHIDEDEEEDWIR